MAVYSGQRIELSFKADVDLSGFQHRFVKTASTAGFVTNADTAGEFVLGVLQNKPRAGEEANVRVHGTTKIELASGSAASFGGFLKTASNGQAEGYQSLTASVYAVAQALGEPSAAASGVFIEAALLYPGIQG